MFDTEQICPYTGLRSFTEEESLYFKGREDDIDQATEQLQRNKFLMLTGASGDGKSSLIYAGIIPNARAGFLKAKYTHWCVADFRPERTPFKNLCKAIARQLDITNLHTVQAELHHGFSAVIDLYKNSKRYIDRSSLTWQSADEAGKTVMKREAANLLILVDQFEEFFTNPENYHRGVPSTDANLVLNLLLETARIALEEDLPIYIVFTMRSDFIGQCAAFRGLPEYIGFSQFFVPRLNRTQLQQVIEEPAVLSGNKITRRLTERLIHDLTEGVDQLPILQHALNQVWHAAVNGKEEMDLVHYAMVGGMAANELPDEQVDRFKAWFGDLPPHIKACYHKPNLQNVLDTHTNKLYEQASAYYKKNTGKPISDEDAKAIIKTAFICLTKIDQSRAVRNRMTLHEITHILGRQEFDTGDVGNVLNIFREPGNTFIRPFIMDGEDTRNLNEDNVLDITHESLIRNWAYLEQWAKEEFENYSISLDFEQQLNRWVESDKSKGFLLPIGPLTYFENWFNKLKPNAYWIARYLPEEIEQEKKLSRAKQVLGNMKEFLKQSADRHVVTRTIMRYGPKRIAATLGLIGIIVLSSFAVRNYIRKQNDNVLKSIKEQTIELANAPKLGHEFQVPLITEQLILDNLTIPEVIDRIKDVKQKIKIATNIASQLVFQGRNKPQGEISQSLTIADSLLEQLTITNDNREISDVLKLNHDYSFTAGLAHYFNPDDSLKKFVINCAKRSARWAMYLLKEQPEGFEDILFLGLALENGINHKLYSSDEINQLLGILSPFENNVRTPWIEKNFQKDRILSRGAFPSYGIRFNGLFQDLAYLYAAAGKPGMALQCMDSLLRYQESFFQNDYATYIENASNIAAVFFTYETTEYLNEFVSGYCHRKNISATIFYNRLVSAALINYSVWRLNNLYSGGGGQRFINLNIKFSSNQMISFFFAKLKEEILKIKDIDERNFTLAFVLKNEASLLDYRKDIRDVVDNGTDRFYKEAINYYLQVSREYLNQSITVIGQSGADVISTPRRNLFLFPDYRVSFHPFEPRSVIQFFTSSAFIQYVLKNNLVDTIYENADDFKVFENWLLDYHASMTSRDWMLHDAIPATVLDQLASKLEERKANQSADLNLLYFYLSEDAFNQDNPEKGIAYLRKVQPDKLLNAFQFKLFDFVNNYSLQLVGNAIASLTVNNQFDLAYAFLNVFKKEVNRSSLYAYASQKVSLEKQSSEIARRLLDSAITEMKRLDNPAVFQPNRHQIAIALMYMDPEKNSEEAYKTIKNSFAKFAAMFRFSKAYGLKSNLYKGILQAPDLISDGDKSGFLASTVQGFNYTKPSEEKWKKFKENRFFFPTVFLPYINENE